MKKASIFIFFTLLLSACYHIPSDSDEEYYSEEYGFEDGTYCAQVEYYNPNTGTRSEYTLNVDVESNELVLIHWANGGWLDEDHFVSEELNSEGYCEFTSDKGYEYTVTINGPACSFTEEGSLQNEIQQDEVVVTCSLCGNEKEDYEDYCSSCKDRRDHTCGRCGQYDSFMFSSDDYCSDCEDEIENTCSQCGGHEYNVNGGLCDDCQSE